jgi:hypothetical protein
MVFETCCRCVAVPYGYGKRNLDRFYSQFDNLSPLRGGHKQLACCNKWLLQGYAGISNSCLHPDTMCTCWCQKPFQQPVWMCICSKRVRGVPLYCVIPSNGTILVSHEVEGPSFPQSGLMWTDQSESAG